MSGPLAISFLDGWDYCDHTAHDLYKYSFTGGATFQLVGGRFGGQAARLTSVGNPILYTRVLTIQQNWYLSMSWAPSNDTGTSYMDGPFFLIKDPLNVILLALFVDAGGFLRIYTGGGGTRASRGTLLGVSSWQHPIDVWSSVDLVAKFGASGSAQIWVNDTLALDLPHVTWASTSSGDRFAWTHDQANTNWGWKVDDVAIAHGGRPGPSRIVAGFPIADALPPQWTPNGGTSNAGRVNEKPGGLFFAAPDDDTTYVAGSPGNVDLYRVDPPPCFGRNLAVALNAAARGSSSPRINLLCRPTPGAVDVAPGFIVPALTYSILQAIQETSLVTGGVWTDGEIGNAWWGIGAAAGSCAVTQFFIEKLTSLRAVSYDCGQAGNYWQ